MTDEYFSWLAIDATNEEFSEEVASVIEREQNDWIFSQIDLKLRENADILKELIASANKEDLEELRTQITGISIKLGTLRTMIEAYENNLKLGSQLEQNPSEVTVVYAKNPYGNIMCSKDFSVIQDYGDEKYDLLISLLNKLYNGDTNFNTEKQRPLTSSDKLKGIYELKEFKVRLIYMREGEYTVVLGALVKKDDNDKKYRSTLENMKKKSESYRRAIRDGKLDIEEELKIAEEFRGKVAADVKKGK